VRGESFRFVVETLRRVRHADVVRGDREIDIVEHER